VFLVVVPAGGPQSNISSISHSKQWYNSISTPQCNSQTRIIITGVVKQPRNRARGTQQHVSRITGCRY
jgi:hypothetical protein